MQTGADGAGALRAGKSPLPWPLLLGWALVGAQHGFLGHCPDLSQWTSEDLGQEPLKGGRTLGQEQVLLLDVATYDQCPEGTCYPCSFSPGTYPLYHYLPRATHMHTTVLAHTSQHLTPLHHSCHACCFEITCRYKLKHAILTTHEIANTHI